MNIPPAGILACNNGKVLLVRHKDASSHSSGKYGILAGRIQPEESKQQAAIREFHE